MDTPTPPVSPRRNLAINLSIALGSVVLFLIGLQVVLKLRSTPPPTTPVSAVDAGLPDPDAVSDGTPFRYMGIFRDSKDPILRRELIPNSGNRHIVVNDLGYIGKRYPKERSPDTFRILGLGDSVTMYYGAEEQNYLSIMEHAYTAQAKKPTVEVLNFGVAGYETRAEVRRLEVEGLQYKPDLVIVGYVLNDAIQFPFVINSVFGKAIADEAEGESVGVIDFLSKSLGSAQSTKQDFFDKVFSSRDWANSVTALNQLAQFSEANNFKVVVVVFPMFISFNPYQLQPMHDAVKVQAERHHFGFLDLAPTFAALNDFKSYAEHDDTVHPNARGHEVAGKALYDYLVSSGFAPPKAAPTH